MMLWIYARLPTRTTDIKFNPINHIDMKTKLSPYTIASNCTDLTDIRDGINEIQDEMKRLVSEGKNVPSFFYSRLSKLQTKRKKFEQKPDSHECDHPFLHRRGNSYNGYTPLPALPDRTIFSECKESHQECSPEQRKIHLRFP